MSDEFDAAAVLALESSGKDKKERKEKREKKEKKEKKEDRKESKKDRKSKRSSSDDDHSTDDDAPKKKRSRRDKEETEVATPPPTDAKDDAQEGALENFRISPGTIAALKSRGITSLFPIQIQSFDALYDGRDLLGRARTGSGKTLAFALPLIERLKADVAATRQRGRYPRALVLAPTRELAKQVGDDFVSTCKELETLCVYGGVPMGPQQSRLRMGVDVIVGTPGRMMDLMESRSLNLTSVQYVVLDEADRMLDMGFKDDVEKILAGVPSMVAFKDARDKSAVKKEVQTILFSATVPTWVKEVATRYMSNPLTVDLVEGEAASLDVQHLILQCPWQTRADTIADLIRCYGGTSGKTVIFVETKREADELAVNPVLTSKVEVKAMHGDVPQSAREATLTAFKKGTVRCIVATDVAARGLDIKGVDLVIQTQPPCGNFSGRADVDTYVHRSGRTGRAGAKGTCITLYTRQQEPLILELERATKNTFTRIGAPQPEDIVRATGTEAVDKLKKVHEDTAEAFRSVAEEALVDVDAVDTLARALALIAGYTDAVGCRSLLNSSEGFSTYAFSDPRVEVQSPGYVWGALKRMLSPELCEAIRGMTLTADKHGAVFDVPAEYVNEIKEAMKRPNSGLSKPTVLPELQSNVMRSSGHGGYGGAGGRGNFGSRHGSGGHRGGGGHRGHGGGGGGYGHGGRGNFHGGRSDDRGGFRGGFRSRQ